jgi:hypothetical protein
VTIGAYGITLAENNARFLRLPQYIGFSLLKVTPTAKKPFGYLKNAVRFIK